MKPAEARPSCSRSAGRALGAAPAGKVERDRRAAQPLDERQPVARSASGCRAQRPSGRPSPSVRRRRPGVGDAAVLRPSRVQRPATYARAAEHHCDPMPILCLGEAIVDLVCEQRARPLADADAFVPHFGGALANVAVAAARAGADAALPAASATTPGDGGWGKRLRDEGVRHRLDRRRRGDADAAGVRHLRPRPRADLPDLRGGIDAALHRSADASRGGGRDAGALVFGSNTLVGKPERESRCEARRLRATAVIPVLFDPNIRPNRWADLDRAVCYCRSCATAPSSSAPPARRRLCSPRPPTPLRPPPGSAPSARGSASVTMGAEGALCAAPRAARPGAGGGRGRPARRRRRLHRRAGGRDRSAAAGIRRGPRRRSARRPQRARAACTARGARRRERGCAAGSRRPRKAPRAGDPRPPARALRAAGQPAPRPPDRGAGAHDPLPEHQRPNRDRAYERLRERFPTWEDVRDAPVDEVMRRSGPAGWPTRRRRGSRRSCGSSATPRPRLARDAPREEAIEVPHGLPGVGRKTAACVMIFTCGRPEIPVDTHVYRVGGRLGCSGPAPPSRRPTTRSAVRSRGRIRVPHQPDPPRSRVCRPRPRCPSAPCGGCARISAPAARAPKGNIPARRSALRPAHEPQALRHLRTPLALLAVLVPLWAFGADGDPENRSGNLTAEQSRASALRRQLRDVPHALRSGHRRRLRSQPRPAAGADGTPDRGHGAGHDQSDPEPRRQRDRERRGQPTTPINTGPDARPRTSGPHRPSRPPVAADRSAWCTAAAAPDAEGPPRRVDIGNPPEGTAESGSGRR